ncbi:MAG TPA: hypothetical protein VFV92_14000, partial [Candidatus Bathyarchaeia archaeon]|nr:hypothetical protein [Candidatus Bathyarchaeia archaeon]
MTNSLLRFRHTGSFIAGLLIDLSVVIWVFAMESADPGNWQTMWVIGASVILALGLTLQVVVSAAP